jgi:hypothetical protein
MPDAAYWNYASPVFCDENENIIIINLGKGSTMGKASNLVSSPINGTIPESISSLQSLNIL